MTPSVDPYASDVVSRLWPGARPPHPTRRPVRGDLAERSWWVLPSPRRARLLVPVGRPEAAVMLVRHGEGARRLVRAATAAVVRSGLAGLLPLARLTAGASGGPMQEMVESVLGTPVTCGLLLGPPRPNRKPVLQVFGPDGSTLAFVKVGTDPATSTLVSSEARCLAEVGEAGLRLVQPPPVLHAGRVGDLEVLVLGPLSSSQQAGRQAFPPPPLAAMAEVAQCRGTTRETLSQTAFWREAVVRRLDEVRDAGTRDRLRGLTARVAERCGGTAVETGSWHGDWAPWNTGRVGDLVQLWDWERFSSSALWGLDLVHYLAQQVRHASAERVAQERELLAAWPRALSRSPAPGPEQDAEAVLLSYLLALALRFTAGGDARPDGHPRATWAADLAVTVLRYGP